MDKFFQQPPEAGNRFRTDSTLRLALQWRLPKDVYMAAAPHLDQLGGLAATVMPPLAEHAERNPPRHVPFEPWGRRVDRIEVAESWLELMHLGQRQGLVALPYEDPYSVHTRVVQAGLINLYDPVCAVADCPLVMTDGAATLLNEHDPELARRYVPRLIAREGAWTSGQWMTERAGGSDVGLTDTRAVLSEDGTWSLHGSKWFTSATTSDIALALARPENGEAGSRGLSLFLVELRDQAGGWNNIQVRRLKDKFGTRALPTAELDLIGTRAVPVGGLGGGVRKLTGLLSVARFWASIGGLAGVGHLLALARDYAVKREAFGVRLVDNPIHREWFGRIAVIYDAMVVLNLEAAAQLGRVEHGGDGTLARLLIPLTKLACARQGVWAGSELLESFGGAGYVEDTGIPRIFSNLHVNCIWEGTTSVLAHDVLRALKKPESGEAFIEEIVRRLAELNEPASIGVRDRIEEALDLLVPMINQPQESQARRLAWGMARTFQALLLAEFGMWRWHQNQDSTGIAAARLFVSQGLVDAVCEEETDVLHAVAFGQAAQ
jgi:alkylation response protein AidB-like acyl-CoA dehydrogenase